MPLQRNGTFVGRTVVTRRVIWVLLILTMAVPIAFISGRLERERTAAAVSYGEAIAMWDGQSDVPPWLAESAGHPILLLDLAKRLGLRPPEAEEVIISASIEDDGAGGNRWRVTLSWPDTPSVELLVAFEGLESSPRLVGVGGGPPMETRAQ